MDDSAIRYEFEVDIPRDRAYALWTSAEGISGFFCSNHTLDFRPAGKFECYFNPEAAEGNRGGEGVVILAMEKDSMFSFTWNFPPVLSVLRDAGQRTTVQIFFSDAGEGRSRIEFVNSGYGKGEIWQKGREYFIRAWGDIVLPKFRYVTVHGTIPDLSNPPDYSGLSLNNPERGTRPPGNGKSTGAVGAADD